MDQALEVINIKKESTDSTSPCRMDIPNETPINSIKEENKNIVPSDIHIKKEPEEERENCEPPVNTSTFYVISPTYDIKKETDEPLDKIESENQKNETRDDPSDDSIESRVHEPLIKIEPIEEEENNFLGKHFLDTEKHSDLQISTSNIQVNEHIPMNLSEPKIKTGPTIEEKNIFPGKNSLNTKKLDSDDNKSKIQVGMLQQLLSKPENEKEIVKLPEENGENKEANIKEAKYVCPVCQKIFSKLCGLVRHKIMHTERPYKCEYCEKKFNQKCHLAQHVVIHTGVKPFVCETCNKGFGHRSDLNKHRWIHSEVKPFTCSECNRSFTQKPHFIQHVRIHTGARPYTCDFCDKTFSQKSHLTVHRRFHTGERPYTCNICDKSFAQISNLNQHKKIHER